MFIKGWKDEENAVNPYNGILLNNKKEIKTKMKSQKTTYCMTPSIWNVITGKFIQIESRTVVA